MAYPIIILDGVLVSEHMDKSGEAKLKKLKESLETRKPFEHGIFGHRQVHEIEITNDIGILGEGDINTYKINTFYMD